MFSFDLGTVPDWVAGIGTVGTLAAALVQISRERAKNASERSKAEAEEERSQATQVASWIVTTYPMMRMVLQNGSDTPIYSAVISFVYQSGPGPRTSEEAGKQQQGSLYGYRLTRFVIPPGSYEISFASPWEGKGPKPQTELAFTDSRGKHWVRRFDGKLEKLKQDPLTTMNYKLPFEDFELKPYSG